MSFPEAVHLTGESASALSTKRCMEAGQSSSDCFHQDFAPGLKLGAFCLRRGGGGPQTSPPAPPVLTAHLG